MGDAPSPILGLIFHLFPQLGENKIQKGKGFLRSCVAVRGVGEISCRIRDMKRPAEEGRFPVRSGI